MAKITLGCQLFTDIGLSACFVTIAGIGHGISEPVEYEQSLNYAGIYNIS